MAELPEQRGVPREGVKQLFFPFVMYQDFVRKYFETM
jgi:hypothetical protein